MFAKSKLNSTEILTLQALIDMYISHEEFIIILNEKDNLRNENGESYDIMRLRSVKSKI